LRGERGLLQGDLAERLGVSPSYLSRVESGEKALSNEALGRLASLLGMDPVKVQLRAGVVPPELMARIASAPESFIRWTRQQ
jgi:transcriptional regulator with XRE-family HTH domain